MEEKKTTKRKINGRSVLKESVTDIEVAGLATISKDVKESAIHITRNQLRFLVDAYNQTQDDRIAKFNQVRAVKQGVDDGTDERCLAIEWLAENRQVEEKQIKKMLEEYVKNDPVGQWIIANIGVGPVFAATFLAYFDITKVSHAGQFISYCGLNDYANPWYGNDKAGVLVRFTYDINAAYTDLFECVLKDCMKKFDIKEKDMKAIHDLLNKKLDNIYQWSTALAMDKEDLTDDEYDIISPVIDKLIKYKDFFEYLIENFYDIAYEYKDKFFDDVEHIKSSLLKEMVNIVTEDQDMVDDIDDDNVIIDKDLGKILPNYLNKTYETIMTLQIPDDITPIEISSWLRSRYVSGTVTPEVIRIFCDCTGRSYNVVHNGVTSLKKKDKQKYNGKDDLKKYAAKPPYNKDLKVACHLLGESFIKQSNKEGSLYGRLFRERKEKESRNNRKKQYSSQAVMAVSMKDYDKKTSAYAAYSKGMLPDAHINARAKRFAVRVFIVHLFECMWIHQYGTAPEKFFPLEYLGHTDYIAPEVPYSDYVKVPKEYYEQYEGYNMVSSLKEFYDL